MNPMWIWCKFMTKFIFWRLRRAASSYRYKSYFILLSTAEVMTWCGFCCFSKCTGMPYGMTNRRWYDRILTVKNHLGAEETRKRSFFNLTTDPKHLSKSTHIILSLKKIKFVLPSAVISHPIRIIYSKHLKGMERRIATQKDEHSLVIKRSPKQRWPYISPGNLCHGTKCLELK